MYLLIKHSMCIHKTNKLVLENLITKPSRLYHGTLHTSYLKPINTNNTLNLLIIMQIMNNNAANK